MTPNTNRPWTQPELDYLRTNYRTTCAKVIAHRMGRTTDAVTQRASRMAIPKHRKWTAEDMAYLKAHAGAIKDKTIAVALGRSEEAVKRMRAKSGLCAPAVRIDGYRVVTVALPEDVVTRLHAARAPGETLSAYLRNMINQHLEEERERAA